MSWKEIIGGVATLVGTTSCLMYLWQVFHRTIKPHVFSWFIWGAIGLIGFAAQYTSHAGPGCWSIGVSAAFCLVIAALGLFYGEISATRSDWGCLIFSILAIIAWKATDNSLWAVIIVSAIDAIAFFPTFRKSWMAPHQEGMVAFLIYGLQGFLSILALESYTMTTVLYPATIVFLNMSLAVTLFYRRRILA